MVKNNMVCFGEILWDVLPSGAKPGGAPMNAAYHLQKLGMRPAVITRIGVDSRGEQLLALLERNAITTDFIQKDAAQPTGVVLASLNERAEASYDIVAPVAWDFIEAHEDLEKLVAESEYFVFGSLAARSAVARNTLFQLLDRAKTRVLDINLRTPHFSKQSVEMLLQQCQILKVNEAELQLISGWYNDVKTLEGKMALLQDMFNIETIVTTCGSAGAVLNQNGGIYRHPGFNVRVNDTVGSGDAFLAAFLFKLHYKAPAAEVLQFANGFGAYVASQEGAWPAYDVGYVEKKIKDAFQDITK